MTTKAVTKSKSKHASGTHPGKGKIDFKKAFKMRFVQGMTYENIAKHFNTTNSAAYQLLKPIDEIMQRSELYPAYHTNANRIQEVGESLLLQEMLSEDKLKKASVNNIAYAYDKLRTARQGTPGAGVSVTIELIFQEAEANARKLRKSHDDIIINKVED
jgi:hypothetical protein